MSSFYKMDPAAWDFGTADLSLEEEAAYLRIINAIHKHDGPVPNNDRVLAGLFRSSTRKARSLVDALVAAGKVSVEGGEIWNGRARSDLARRQLASDSAASRGAKGGKARAENAEARHNSQSVHDHFVPISTPEMGTNQQRTNSEPHRKVLENNDTGQANASSRIEENRIEDSVAKATDGDAVDDDFAKQLFDRAVAFLGRHGTNEKAARTLVGRWRKDHQDSDIFKAFTECSKAGAVDPIPYITETLKGKGPKHAKPSKSSDRLSAFIAGARGAS